MNQGQLLERVYREIHDDIVDGLATGGSATTIVDSTLASKYTENKFKNWIAFISTTTDELTPQSKYATISAYVNSTGTATIATLTDAVGAGDTYSFAKGTIPLLTMGKLVNDALGMLGRITYLDTSLTTAATTLNYTLPIATKGVRPNKVYLRKTDYTEYDVPNYQILPAAGGSTETLLFDTQPPYPYTIVIEYNIIHPALTLYSSTVSETIHDALVVAACVERVYHWKMTPKMRKLDVQNWQLAKQSLAEAKAMYPIQRPVIFNQRPPINLFNGTGTQRTKWWTTNT